MDFFFHSLTIDISKIKSPCSRQSISPRKKRISNHSNAKKLIEKHISLNSLAKKRFSWSIHPTNPNAELKRKDSKSNSLELLQAKTRKFYQKYNLKEKGENHIRSNNIKNIMDHLI